MLRRKLDYFSFNIVREPHTITIYSALSTTSHAPIWRTILGHYVTQQPVTICSHALAVAEKEDEIASYLTWYGKITSIKKRNLTSAANLNVKKSILGNNGKRSKRKRSGQPPSPSLSKKRRAPQLASTNLNG